MAKTRNIAIASDLSEKFKKAKAVIVTDYRGLTHKQSEELHKAVKKVDGEYIVVKNSLLKIASGKETTGPTAVLLSYGDELSPIKELFKFIKNITKPTVKFGFVGETRYEESDIAAMAKLPAKEVLQSQVISRIAAPLYGLTYSLNFNIQKLVSVLQEVKNSGKKE